MSEAGQRRKSEANAFFDEQRRALIARYVAAYEAANSKPFPYTIEYRRGWYRWSIHTKRRAEVERMAKTLEARAAAIRENGNG